MKDIKKQLIEIVGQEHILDEPEILADYRGDQRYGLAIEPKLVVRPGDASQVQGLVTWANRTRSKLIPVSSGPPHLYGDTAPTVPGCVIVELSRMNRILRIDKRNRMAVVEPGVTYDNLQPELSREGLRVTTPLLPRKNKSVIASLLERQPTTIPRYHYSLTEPLRNCGVVWGNGETTYTGEAGNGPYSLQEQWKGGMRQVDPKGPAQTDFLRLLTGAQGSLGIVTWASIRCELLPSIRKFYFVSSRTLESLIDFVYRLQRLRLGDELMIVNQTQLATMLGKQSDRIDELRGGFPPWVVIIGVAGRALFPEERVEVQEKDIAELAQQFGLVLLSGIAGVTNREIQETVLNPCDVSCFKMTYKGACEEIFFLTTLDRVPGFREIVFSVASDFNYPASEIGIYIQPQHQGTSQHCEFNLPYNPKCADESNRLKELYSVASERLIANGAYFARPYGDWADMVYNRDARSTNALRTIKQIFDPNSVMNPGRLCFRVY